MGMLNSILLEGTITAISSETTKDNEPYCRFSIKTKHTKPPSYNSIVQSNIFPIECTGLQAEMCLNYFKAGTKVRVVGHLNKDEKDITIVVGEHIEILVKNTEVED